MLVNLERGFPWWEARVLSEGYYGGNGVQSSPKWVREGDLMGGKIVLQWNLRGTNRYL